jgi:hypothetical protein
LATDERMIAACGLVWDGCDMMEASTNAELAQRISDWFKRELSEDVKPEQIHCAGCRGDRDVHWSADCWILLCCVDRRGLDFCYECEEFPCGRLEEWAGQNDRYGEALERLRTMQQRERRS